MKRLFGHGFAAVAVGVLATAFTPACAENDSSVFVRMAIGPSTNRQNGSCLYTSDPTQPMLSEGVVDAALRDTYSPMLLVGNQLVPRGDANATRAESNRVHVNGAVVRVTDPNGGTIGEFTSLGSSYLDPQLNNAPSYGPVAVDAIDPPTMRKIAESFGGGSKLVVANIKVFGRTLGGVDVESGEFQLPIRVCKGCLIDFTSGDDPAFDGVDCRLPLAEGGGGQTTAPCALGQDELTPCQLCAKALDACRSPLPAQP